MAKVKARKDKIMRDDRARPRVVVRGHGRVHLHPRPRPVRGPARDHASTAELLEADKIFLNVGGRAVAPDMPGLADIDYLTNVGILELDTVPSIS